MLAVWWVTAAGGWGFLVEVAGVVERYRDGGMG